MNKVKFVLFAAGIVLLFSCNSNVEPQPSLPSPDTQESGYCVYEAEKICLPTQTVCPSSAPFRKTCPYSSSSSNLEIESSSSVPSSSSNVSSSSFVVPSSSSAKPSSSSVASCADFVDGTKREHYGMEKEQFCDSRDGKKYVYVKIGTQIWMAENLNYNAGKCANYNCSPESNYCSLSEIKENSLFCDIYGRLYHAPQKVFEMCPSGWHLPSINEWNKLLRHVDGTKPSLAEIQSPSSIPYESPTAGKYLKAKEGWNDCGTFGSGKSYSCEDTYGFSALPGGWGIYIPNSQQLPSYNGNFINDGSGSWWGFVDSGNYGYKMFYDEENTSYYENGSRLASIRCVKD